MAKKRAFVKYAALGVITTAYVGGAAIALHPESKEELPAATAKHILTVAGGLLALTWVAGLL